VTAAGPTECAPRKWIATLPLVLYWDALDPAEGDTVANDAFEYEVISGLPEQWRSLVTSSPDDCVCRECP
jgi:hypothetical protein